jgi:hypothetical protein
MSPAKYELWFYIPEDGILHSHRRGNLKYYKHWCNVALFRKYQILLHNFQLIFTFAGMHFNNKEWYLCRVYNRVLERTSIGWRMLPTWGNNFIIAMKSSRFFVKKALFLFGCFSGVLEDYAEEYSGSISRPLFRKGEIRKQIVMSSIWGSEGSASDTGCWKATDVSRALIASIFRVEQ